MSRVDRLIKRATDKMGLCNRLEKNNPYLGKTDAELLDCLSEDNYRAPDMYTTA